MKSKVIRKKIFATFKAVIFSFFFVLWSVGMFIGGMWGMVAVAVGIPVALCMTVCD
ncbi:MAG: hypothetical protein IKP88_13975 [Lachnospiraceae bacterium]|nr:hypothetical protein [Lachnospiraceae bacterium]